MWDTDMRLIQCLVLALLINLINTGTVADNSSITTTSPPTPTPTLSCAEQIHRCGALAEEFELQVQETKILAFRRCFQQKKQCIEERIAFDDCFIQSQRAVRAIFNSNSDSNTDSNSDSNTDSNFTVPTQSYKELLNECFSGSGSTSLPPPPKNNPQNLDALLAHILYGSEFADRLWALSPEGGVRKPSLDPQAACLSSARDGVPIFGSGGESTTNTTLCSLSDEEMLCYRRTLDYSSQFQLMLQNRDKTLRSCIESIRHRPECRLSPNSNGRDCICNAKNAFEGRMRAELVNCARDSRAARLYKALMELDTTTNSQRRMNQQQLLNADDSVNTAFQHSDDPLSVSTSGVTISNGVMLNGQCLCTCGGGQPSQRGVSASLDPLSVDGGIVIPTGSRSAYQQQQPVYYYPSAAPTGRVQQRPIQYYYAQPSGGGGGGGAASTVLNTEAGIADGFERFFSGQLPIRRRRRHS